MVCSFSNSIFLVFACLASSGYSFNEFRSDNFQVNSTQTVNTILDLREGKMSNGIAGALVRVRRNSKISGISWDKRMEFRKNGSDTAIQVVIDSVSKVGYKMEKSLPAGYRIDGTVDYTANLQKAINEHNVIVFPDFPLLINEKGLIIPSDRIIVFPLGSKLILMPNSLVIYNVINIKDRSNVSLYNPVIEGDRYRHLGKKGEWGMGIGIYSSDNINIYNPKVSFCWGDGIYIGQFAGNKPSHNIRIRDAWCYKNRRNGISIISVDTLDLINPHASFSDGTLPMAGIDIEPSNNSNEIKHVSVVNPVTEFNKGYGICVSLSQLLGEKSHFIGVKILGQNDTGSSTGLYVSCLKYKGNSRRDKSNLSGYVEIVNPQWRKNIKNYFNGFGFRTDDVELIVANPRAKDKTGASIQSKILEMTIRSHTDINGRLKLGLN